MNENIVNTDHVDTLVWRIFITENRLSNHSKVVYSYDGMSFQMLCRWKWYFEYRTALYKVKTPKNSYDLEWYSRKAESNSSIAITHLKNQITSKKAKITEYRNKLSAFKFEYMRDGMRNELYPIETTEQYKLALDKILSREKELIIMENELQTLCQKEN
jgi:hypothetical protein